jgi:hypothetical protein
MLGRILEKDSFTPPMNTEKFTAVLQWILGEFDEVKLEMWDIGELPSDSKVYSLDSKISESIYRFCDGGARFQIAITQLSSEDNED